MIKYYIIIFAITILGFLSCRRSNNDNFTADLSLNALFIENQNDSISSNNNMCIGVFDFIDNLNVKFIYEGNATISTNSKSAYFHTSNLTIWNGSRTLYAIYPYVSTMTYNKYEKSCNIQIDQKQQIKFGDELPIAKYGYWISEPVENLFYNTPNPVFKFFDITSPHKIKILNKTGGEITYNSIEVIVSTTDKSAIFPLEGKVLFQKLIYTDKTFIPKLTSLTNQISTKEYSSENQLSLGNGLSKILTLTTFPIDLEPLISEKKQLLFEIQATKNDGTIFYYKSIKNISELEANKNIEIIIPYLTKNNLYTIGVFGGSLSSNPESESAKKIWLDSLGRDRFSIETKGTGGAGFSARTVNSIPTQIRNAKPYDIYILWASTNDYGYQDPIPVGTYESQDTLSQNGGINLAVKLIRQKNEKALLLFFTSLPVFANYKLKPFVDGQINLCSYQQIPYLDQYTQSGFTATNYKSFYNADAVHLNTQGYSFIGPMQAAFLRKNIYEFLKF